MDAWYVAAFGDHYLDLYSHRNDDEAARVLDFVFDADELNDATVLDVASGPGRYSAALAERGAHAYGVDLSMPLLRESRTRWPRLPVVQADMRALPFAENAFDWCLSMFTSFGYFESEDEHRTLARSWCGLARKGVIVDVPNPGPLMRALVPESERRVEDLCVEERRRIDLDPPRVCKEVRVLRGEELLTHYEERVMLFEPAQIEAFFAAAGFHLTRRIGDYQGGDFELADSPRQLLRFEPRGGGQ